MVLSARHRWPEPKGFELSRPNGIREFVLIHFFNTVEILQFGQRITVQPGGCICYGLGTEQYLYSAEPLIHDWMHLSVDAAPLIAELGIVLDKVIYPADTTFMTAGICDIELEINSDRPFRQQMANAAAQQLLIRYARACKDKGEEHVANPELYSRLYGLRTKMFTHLERSWTVEQMAEQVHLSPSRFFTVYKSMFGISPMNDLIRARVDAARTALAGTDIPITQLAEQLGYANATHFSRQFRQQTGMSPRGYRSHL
ncbi:MAG: helix-turn-helix transcriptional regulator [Firmicutes bacterium]|nr:helix-turn-helix transcriptional regulator [Bacillota bacterium]